MARIDDKAERTKGRSTTARLMQLSTRVHSTKLLGIDTIFFSQNCQLFTFLPAISLFRLEIGSSNSLHPTERQKKVGRGATKARSKAYLGIRCGDEARSNKGIQIYAALGLLLDIPPHY